MADPDVKRVLRIEGQLRVDPTNPNGSPGSSGLGTALGVHEDVVVVIGQTTVTVQNKLSGNISEEYVTVEGCTISVFIRSFDEDVLKTIFPDVDSSTERTLTPTVLRSMGDSSGTRLSTSQGHAILLSPREPEKHPSVLMFNAVAVLTDANSMDFEVDKDWGMVVTFKALPDTSRRLFQMGHYADMPSVLP